MFSKGVMRDKGIDITLKNNPNHVLAPDNWDMVLGVKFGKVSNEEYYNYYTNLIRSRWVTRKQEFIDLAKQGMQSDIKLKCFCPKNTPYCHADIAAKFLNNLAKKL